MSGATETKPDTRPKVAGHPLSWTIEKTSFGREVSDSDRLVMINLDDYGVDVPFWEGLVADVNRLGAPAFGDLSVPLSEKIARANEAMALWTGTSGALVFPEIQRTPQADAAAAMVGDDVEEARAAWEEIKDRFSGVTALTIPGSPAPSLETDKVYVLSPGEEGHGIPDPRIAALEAALAELVDLLLPITIDFGGGSTYDLPLNDKARAILDRIGLAHLFPGNPTEAEEAVAP